MYFNKNIEHSHVSANDGQHRNVTNISKEMHHMCYVHDLSRKL
jgi:hypothetical protein